MRKIPTLFKRDPEDMRRVLPEVTPGCEWVLAGEGIGTRKYDGTCVMLDADGRWWARREVKPDKQSPPEFVVADYDENTGKTVGWEPIEQSPFAKFHAEALDWQTEFKHEAGTYELLGPKINRDPEGCGRHWLIKHAEAEVLLGPAVRLTYEDCRAMLTGGFEFEGIVWHHPDGRMAKLKVRDFASARGRIEVSSEANRP